MCSEAFPNFPKQNKWYGVCSYQKKILAQYLTVWRIVKDYSYWMFEIKGHPKFWNRASVICRSKQSQSCPNSKGEACQRTWGHLLRPAHYTHSTFFVLFAKPHCNSGPVYLFSFPQVAMSSCSANIIFNLKKFFLDSTKYQLKLNLLKILNETRLMFTNSEKIKELVIGDDQKYMVYLLFKCGHLYLSNLTGMSLVKL